MIESGPAKFLDDLKSSASEITTWERTQRLQFEERNYGRWQKPLDMLALLHHISAEVGQQHAQEGPRGGDPIVFDVLAHLHPRALLIASEVIYLLNGGFADGGLARWRSLHEILITSMFISNHGLSAALPYRMGVYFNSYKRAKSYNQYAAELDWDLISPEEMGEIENEKNETERHLGRALENDWNWSAIVLKKKRPNLLDLEKDLGMDNWRPRYKWACQHIHAWFFFSDKLLGMKDSERFVFQIGASNSGLVDPLVMTTMSLAHATSTFLFYPEPDFDRTIHAKVFLLIAEEIERMAIIEEERTLREAQEGFDRDAES